MKAQGDEKVEGVTKWTSNAKLSTACAGLRGLKGLKGLNGLQNVENRDAEMCNV